MTENQYVYDISVKEESYDINGIKDSFNPFDNDTEFIRYNSDYRKIVPQIAMQNCSIPDIPSPQEKKRIRHYFNMVGLFMTGQVVVVNILAAIIVIIVTTVMMGVEGGSAAPELIDAKISNSSINMGLAGLCYMFVNLLIFIIGCEVTDIDKTSLFRTENLKFSTMLRYSVIAVFLQMFSAILSNAFGTLLDNIFGTDIYAILEDTPVTSSITKIIVTVLYTCIIAPVTEELVIRGFVLKNLSRVSQKFGIVVSSLIFALMHDNIPQFILAFLVGMFLGYVAVKHNSIVPTIILHMIVNTSNVIISMIAEVNEPLGNTVSMVWTLFFLIFGVILFIVSLACGWERIPKETAAQKNRGVSLMFTSPWMLVLIAVHTALIVFYSSM